MKIYFLLIMTLGLTPLIGTAQSIDISNGIWTIEEVKSENIDTLYYEVSGNGFVYDMNHINNIHKFLIVCSSLNVNTTIVPEGNWFQELEVVYDYRLNRLQRKAIKNLRKNLKGILVQFYELDDYGNPYTPISKQQNYLVKL